MIGSTYDVKASMSQSDTIWEAYNKFMIGKATGGLGDYEFANLLINVGDLAANQVKRGNMTSENIEDIETLLFGLDGPNADKYFNTPHKGISRAVKTINESMAFACEYLEQRQQYAQPVMSAESYERQFRKLG